MAALLLLISALILQCHAAPHHGKHSKNKSPQLVYDQKQHGDYNVQLHLKDFQIIALLGDESLGGLGDYDYSYDYADFTVKPPSTSKPTTSSTTAKPEIQTTKPTSIKPSSITEEQKPYTLLSSSSDKTTPKPISIKPDQTSTLEPAEAQSEKITTEKPLLKPEENKLNITDKPTLEDKKPMVQLNEQTPGQIQVQILDSPDSYPSNFFIRRNDNLTEGEIDDHISSYEIRNPMGKKCLSGFYRDKKNRCRRIRRPQTPSLPLNFGRLANLAARFRSEKEHTSTSTKSTLTSSSSS